MCRPLYTFAKAAAHLTGTLPNLARLLARQAAAEHAARVKKEQNHEAEA